METVNIEIFSYDVWGNKKDGFDVNQRFFFGKYTIKKNCFDDDRLLLKKLKDIGFFKKGVHFKSLTFWGDDTVINIDVAKTDFPVCEIHVI